jgi:hypothetical protein
MPTTEIRKGTLIGFPATREEIEAVPTPQATSTYTPIAFSDFIDLTSDALNRNGFDLTTESYALQTIRGREYPERLFGVINISPKGGDSDPRWEQAMGLRTSHDKTITHNFVGGANVLVCNNLCFNGTLWLQDFEDETRRRRGRKHTPKSIEHLPMLLDRMLERMQGVFERQVREIEQMHEISLTRAEAADLMIEACCRGAFPFSKLQKVIDEYTHPSIEVEGDLSPYGTDGDTAWDLHNAFTIIQKERKPWDQMQGSEILSSVFRRELQLR